MVTFPVDEVTPAGAPLPTAPLGDLFPEALAVGGDPALAVLVPGGDIAHLETGRLAGLAP